MLNYKKCHAYNLYRLAPLALDGFWICPCCQARGYVWNVPRKMQEKIDLAFEKLLKTGEIQAEVKQMVIDREIQKSEYKEYEYK